MHEGGSKADEEKEEKRMRGNEIGRGRAMQGKIENSEMCTAVKEEIKKRNCEERVK